MPMRLKPRRQRVLMSADAVGGVWTYALELARGLTSLGIDVQIAVLGPAPSAVQREQTRQITGLEVIETGLALDWTASNPPELSKVAAALQERAMRWSADVVHLNAPGHAGVTPWPVPLVVVAHSCVATWWKALHTEPLPADLEWRRQCAADGFCMADAVIAPSQSFARELGAEYGDDLPIHVVLNGKPADDDQTCGARSSILTAGRLWDRGKNVELIDAAAAQCGTEIFAAGDVERPGGERSVFPHLRMLGRLSPDDLANWYKQTGIFISVSRYEPFGLAVLEAAHAGAALILSDISTFRELWDDAALFVDPDDASGLARAISTLRERNSLREELAKRARARALLYSCDRMLRSTLNVHTLARWAYAQRATSQANHHGGRECGSSISRTRSSHAGTMATPTSSAGC